MALPKLKKPKLRLTVPKANPRGLAKRAIPGSVAMFIFAVSSGSIATFAYWFGGTRAVIVVSLLAVLVMAVAALWTWLRKRREAKRADAFGQGLRSAAAGDGFVGDPGEAARLDDLRQNFLRGIEKFREYGKDIYKLPWYVMVGESGSGKTEAIRHSSIRFPEALQDRFQGVGGTYSMHWWFTNHAVILDTAGAMLMGEQTATRFETFLKLLREYRPDCPINGMILAIPVDSLLLDDKEMAREKANQIARQMGGIQAALQMRFPIFVVITKSDKINGFREFCDAAGNEVYARQMMGWSNPDDLDAPVDSERIVRGLAGMLERLRRRRLTLLQEPISLNPAERRIQQVDSLYTLPDAMSEVVLRLKHYLEILFSGGEWVSRPPFFRGVYFTSSMREGSALDRELAAALSISPDKLPGGGIWERERSFFLRDFFLEKMFREHGLVTSLRDTGQILRRRLFSLYGTTAALLAGLLGLAWFCGNKISKGIEREAYLWQTANREWQNGAYLPVVARVPGQDTWRFQEKRKVPVAGVDLAMMLYLAELRNTTVEGMSGAWLFRPLPDFRELEKARPLARRVVLEGSLIKPVIDAAREKMRGATAASDAQEVNALAALIWLEAALWKKEAVPVEALRREIYEPLFEYVTGQKPREDLLVILADLYGPNAVRVDTRAWTSNGLQLANNAAIATGLDRFLGWKNRVVTDSDSALKTRAEWVTKARAYQAAEDRVHQAANTPPPFHETQLLLRQLTAAKADLDALFGASQAPAPSTADGQRYQEGYARIRRAFVRMVNEKFPEDQRLFTDIAKRLEGQEFDPRRLPALPAEEQQLLDENTERLANADLRLYAARFDHYQRSQLLSGDDSKADLIGSLGPAIKKIAELKAAGAPAFTYAGPRQEICQKIGQFIFSFADRQPLVGLLEAYRLRLAAQLDNHLRFPLVLDGKAAFQDTQQLLAACAEIDKAGADFTGAEFVALEREPSMAGALAGVLPLRRGIAQLQMVSKALQKGGQIGMVKISLGAVGADALGKAPPPPPEPPKEKEKPKGKDKDKAKEEVPAAPPPPPPTSKAGVTGVSLYDRQNTPLAVEKPPGTIVESLAQLPVDDGIKVEVFGFPGGFAAEPVRQYTSGAQYQTLWGCLRVALNSLGATSSKTVRVPAGPVSLQFEFQDLLPSKREWPRRAEILGK